MSRANSVIPERRRSPRKVSVMEAWVSSPTATNPEDRLPVTAIDLSRHGVAFDTPNPLPVKAYFKIEIGYGAQSLICEVKTVSCRQIAQGLYQVGAEFH